MHVQRAIALFLLLCACGNGGGAGQPSSNAGSGGVMTPAGGSGPGGVGGGGMSSVAGTSSAGASSGGTSSAGESSGGTSSGGGVGGSPAVNTPCPPARAIVGLHHVGRFDGCDLAGPRFSWSGSGIVVSFRGTEVGVRLKDSPNQYTVVIDGELRPKLVTRGGEALHALASDLDDTEHVLELYRRTEASFGTTVVLGVEVGDGEVLPSPPGPARRIELVGDSISCGYGNEGLTPTCPFSADTENHYASYGALLARELDAELSTIAWSGKGVVSNYGGDRTDPLPALYDRAVPSDRRSSWGFDWKPHAVIINLGTNDYSTNNDPTEAEFVATYTTLLERIREHYPDAFILCTVGPLLGGSDLATARANIQAAVLARNGAGDARVKAHAMTTPNTNPGCDYHPGLATHAAMAAELAAVLSAELGW